VTMRQYVLTSESVTEGHPDKVADQAADAVLDAVLAGDPAGRVACEVLLTTGLAIVAGEVSTDAPLEVAPVVREAICEAGYDNPEAGFDGHSCGLLVVLDRQSPDINQGVSRSLEARSGSRDPRDLQGAGDQGIVYGYACDETLDLMPYPIWLAHRLAERLAEVRKSGIVRGLRPDGKTQVSIAYEDGAPVRLETVVISAQHHPSTDLESLREELRDLVIGPVIPAEMDTTKMRVVVNPAGRFVHGGPSADTGLTGRKIIVDTYGGVAHHGGGSFSGKDPSKVDRSGAYAARWVAKHVVAAGAARRCEVQIAYAIGVARPVAVTVDTFGTEAVDPAQIERAISECFDLRPAAIIDELALARPIYRRTATYGHFGRSGKDFTWEALSRVDELRSALGL
jgi:S-adenosylmethionine synthetase